jgi:hypothetical protein
MWRRLLPFAKQLASPVQRAIIFHVAPITDSRTFKATFPLLVIVLGILAAFHNDTLRTTLLVIAFATIGAATFVSLVLGSQKIYIDWNRNLLFFSYYRPSLIDLTNRIARHLDGKQRLDILTHRNSDFLAALEEGAADFQQVSGNRAVNIASFDIEYVPILKTGIDIGGQNHHLIPLSDFWPGPGMYSYEHRIPKIIRRKILERLDAHKLFALPIGWGLIGVSVAERDLTTSEIMQFITSDQRGFSFDLFFKNVDEIKSKGYELFCYDFWNSIGQLVSLNYTGHMNILEAEQEEIVRAAFANLNRVIPRENIIADPILLLGRMKAAEKSVAIGGSTWFGIRGTLLPISIANSTPAYGGFCECVGLLATPIDSPGTQWDNDASSLIAWVAEHLGNPQYTGGAVRANALLPKYLPGLLPPDRSIRSAQQTDIDLWADQQMQILQGADIIFRQFTAGRSSVERMRELWLNCKTTA